MWPFDQINTYLYSLDRKASPSPTIICDDAKFAIVYDGQVQSTCSWNEIRQVAAFKRDWLTFDVICLQIDRGPGFAPIEIDEEFADYNAFVQSLESHLPGVHASWWSDVAFPAFATNWTVIYKRDLGSPSS